MLALLANDKSVIGWKALTLSSHEDWLREEKFRCQWTSCLEQLTYWTSVTWHLAGRFQSQAEDISV